MLKSLLLGLSFSDTATGNVWKPISHFNWADSVDDEELANPCTVSADRSGQIIAATYVLQEQSFCQIVLPVFAVPLTLLMWTHCQLRKQ